jgi:hypothetical protein
MRKLTRTPTLNLKKKVSERLELYLCFQKLYLFFVFYLLKIILFYVLDCFDVLILK